MPSFHLSDPHRDFTHPGSKELLRGIIAKQGSGLTGYELSCVFNGHLPAGTATECCAYLHALYQLFRTPQDDYTLQVWEDIIWIWLVQERRELESQNQYQRIIDELRCIVHDTLIPALWNPVQGTSSVYTRAHMLMIWMACPWGQHETEDIFNSLTAGDGAQDFILLSIFLTVKRASPGYPLGTGAPKEAFAAFAERFEKHFRESSALYEAVFRLTDFPLPSNDASGSSLTINDMLEKCSRFL